MKIQGKPAEIPSYEVTIIGHDGKAVAETAEGYAALAHGETYKLQFKNNSSERIVAATVIDGKNVGNFVVNANAIQVIDRPVSIAQLFTFLASGTEEAKAANLDAVVDDKLGLVAVTITPEKKNKYDDIFRGRSALPAENGLGFGMRSMRSLSMAPTRSLGAGGTGLSGHSDQRFRTIQLDLDEDRAVVLNLRLAHDAARQIKPAISELPGGEQERPSTPVPPPLPR